MNVGNNIEDVMDTVAGGWMKIDSEFNRWLWLLTGGMGLGRIGLDLSQDDALWLASLRTGR
jgi:hypothetical protein